MKSIKDIKHCLYINLPTRQDRKTHVEKQLTRLNIPFERFDAISPDTTKIQKNTNAVGCSLSHIECLKIAKKNNWPHILIVEDDILFTNPHLFITNFNRFLANTPQFDVCIIAGNNVGPFKQTHSYCAQVFQCQTTTGYLVLNHYFDTLIDNYTYSTNQLINDPDIRCPPKYTECQLKYSLDKWWFQLQKKDKWYIITPLTVTQLQSYSDIEKRFVNYDNAMLTLDKLSFYFPTQKVI